jgi:uncharacterized protein
MDSRHELEEYTMSLFSRLLRRTYSRLLLELPQLRWAAALWIALIAASLVYKHESTLAAAEFRVQRIGTLLPQKDGAVGGYREIPWDSLIPADWDPAREFAGLDFNVLSDADPRAVKALQKLREAWDNAPVVPALNGTRVRMAGYIVPLDVQKRQIKEFLLVPYFGACIHTPPPPANQIIHVVPAKPVDAQHEMSAVWISGTLETVRSNTGLGNAAYYMKADAVAPYRNR